MKNLTWQNPEQLFVAQELINKVKSKCCGIKDENKSYKEIAALMNMTTKGVDFHICKALKALQINLKDYFPLFLYFLMKFH